MSAGQLPTALIVDDEAGIREVFTDILVNKGYRVVTAKDANEALEKVRAEPIDLAFIDIWMPPGIDGIELLKQLKEQGKLTFPVAIVSGYAEVSSAVEAMNCGAIDVINKPVERKRIEALVEKVQQDKSKELFSSVVKEVDLGKTQAMIKLKGQLLKAADTKAVVSFTGPHSRGSELFAAMLHRPGKRWLRTADLTQLENSPESWVQELRFGTLYLSDLERASAGQLHGLSAVLRAATTMDLQIVIESQRTLAELAKLGILSTKLKDDLAPNEIQLPPLETYVKDIKLLLPVLAQRFCSIDGLAPVSFDPGAVKALESCAVSWSQQGLNVFTGVSRLLLRMANDGVVTAAEVNMVTGVVAAAPKMISMEEKVFDLKLRDAREVFERTYLLRLLEQTNQQVLEAAKISGLERTYLYRKIKNLLSEEEINQLR